MENQELVSRKILVARSNSRSRNTLMLNGVFGRLTFPLDHRSYDRRQERHMLKNH